MSTPSHTFPVYSLLLLSLSFTIFSIPPSHLPSSCPPPPSQPHSFSPRKLKKINSTLPTSITLSTLLPLSWPESPKRKRRYLTVPPQPHITTTTTTTTKHHLTNIPHSHSSRHNHTSPYHHNHTSPYHQNHTTLETPYTRDKGSVVPFLPEGYKLRDTLN
ncbi:hypothetical protein Pcinc_042496 [Petrolisthes cinctipes]|uniref:Uncharacterized protein n=1 Tax=Petrolisthes cinctipes TaxID=88211 RepID=A0AAE1BJS4_PETCI|nr:hypothetical protein Pcinc_042496 [Petrolisthes cinctipes]